LRRSQCYIRLQQEYVQIKMGKVIHLLLTSLDSNMFSVKQTEADRTDLLEGYLKTLYQLRQYD